MKYEIRNKKTGGKFKARSKAAAKTFVTGVVMDSKANPDFDTQREKDFTIKKIK